MHDAPNPVSAALDSITSQHDAERATGLTARLIVHPNLQHPWLSHQLGRLVSETLDLPKIPRIRDAIKENVYRFELIGFGATWAEAVHMAGMRKEEDPQIEHELTPVGMRN